MNLLMDERVSLSSDNDWECGNCGARNGIDAAACIACGKERGQAAYATSESQDKRSKFKPAESLVEKDDRRITDLPVYFRIKLLPAYLLGVLLVLLFSEIFPSNILLSHLVFLLMVIWNIASGRFWLFFLSWIFAFFIINPDFFVGANFFSLIVETFILNILFFLCSAIGFY